MTRAQLLEIHEIATGLPNSPIDGNKLDSALARPLTHTFGHELYPSLWDKTACLLHSIATTHPFTVDGNKRAAWVAARTVLRLNGWELTAAPDDAEVFVLGVVAHQIEIPEAARWLLEHSHKVPVPSATDRLLVGLPIPEQPGDEDTPRP